MSSKARLPVLVLVFAVAGGGALTAERITNIGILDLKRVTTTYFRESKAVRELEQLRDQISAERRRLEAEIYDLQERKLEADTNDDAQQALLLDQQLFDRRQYLRDYVTVKNNQLAQLQARLAESDAFLDELVAAIAFVAETEGLSLVLNRDSALFLFFLPEIDITDLVIAELGRRARSN